jgi:hypothetical protein
VTVRPPAVRYRDSYRFQLESPLQSPTGIFVACPGNDFVGLSADGVMTLAAGYAWDGASGPIKQSKSIIRGSAVHDGGYQLIRNGFLPAECRKAFDAQLRLHCIEDGMPSWQAWIVYAAVRTFGGRFTTPESRKPVLQAP